MGFKWEKMTTDQKMNTVIRAAFQNGESTENISCGVRTTKKQYRKKKGIAIWKKYRLGATTVIV